MLGHTSSMIHICQRLGLLVFKYDSDIPTNPVDKKYCFKSADDVLIKLKQLLLKKLADIWLQKSIIK